MIPGVNIEEVKKYNATLKEYRDKSSKIQAGIEFNEKELARLCQELTISLGVEVTPDNIERIRADFISKINNTLSVGMEIIERIKSEEMMIAESQTQCIQNNAVTPGAGAGIPGASVMPQTFGMEGQIQNPAQQFAVAPQPPVQPQQVSEPQFGNLDSIPPIFGQI